MLIYWRVYAHECPFSNPGRALDFVMSLLGVELVPVDVATCLVAQVPSGSLNKYAGMVLYWVYQISLLLTVFNNSTINIPD